MLFLLFISHRHEQNGRICQLIEWELSARIELQFLRRGISLHMTTSRMLIFLFSKIDLIEKKITENPRIIGLFGIFFFFSCAALIAAWDMSGKSSHRQPVLKTLSDCVVRSQVRNSFSRADDSKPNRMVNDMCGEEARKWSDRLALQEIAAEKKRLASDGADDALNDQIVSMTVGYPIEQMAGSIAMYDREVAALLVGIAKKESNWGKRVPRSSDGADCFNYWGFKGAGSRGVAMGHGCFGSPEEAVEAVGNRVAELVRIRATSEPKNFTIWKCGSSCATHSPESVRKWVSDVDQYYRVLALK